MVLKFDIKFDTKALINKVKDLAKKSLSKKVMGVFSEGFVDYYMHLFSQVYDELLLNSMPHFEQDPTSPIHLKPNVMRHVRRVLETNTSGNIKTITTFVKGVNRGMFGFDSMPSKTEQDKVKLFYFYLEGMVGDMVFVTPDMLSAFNTSANGRMGRFGKGFLMSGETYKRLLDRPEREEAALPPYDKVKHPFSGHPPIRLFEEVWRRVELKQLLRKNLKNKLV